MRLLSHDARFFEVPFGLGQRACLTIGTLGIVINSRGWKPFYVRHEMIHHLQNEQLGMLTAWTKPKWFVEGMAILSVRTHVQSYLGHLRNIAHNLIAGMPA